MFSDLARYPQVIAPLHYTDDAMLMGCLDSEVIGPAERKAQELAGKVNVTRAAKPQIKMRSTSSRFSSSWRRS